MNADTDFSFRMEPTSCRSQDLIYEEGNHKLVVHLEIACQWNFDWGGCDTAFQKWTEPAGEDIPAEKQAQILSRLADWSRKQRVRIDIGPPFNMDEFRAKLKAGRQGLLKRLAVMVRVFFKR